MSIIKFDQTDLLNHLKDSANKELKDPSIPPAIGELELSAGKSFDVEKVTLSFDASTKLGLMLFNSSDDEDSDGIIGKKPGAEQDEMSLPPQIEFNADNAWLKYSLVGNAKASASSDTLLDYTDFDLKGGKTIAFNSYRIHEPGKKLKDELLNDLKSFKFIFLEEDVLKLKENESLSMRVNGIFRGNVAVSWSDIFTRSLGKIAKLANVDELVKIEIGPSITASFNWSIADDFIICFTKNKGGDFTLGVKKAKTKESTGQLAFKISAGFKDKEQVKKILTKIENKLIGEKISKIKDIIAKADVDSILSKQTKLNDTEKEIVQAVINKLKLNRYEDSLKKIRQEIEKWQTKIQSVIEDIASAQISMGLTYQYNRIQTDTTLFQAKLTPGAVKNYHKDLILSKFSRFIDACKNNENGIVLEKFLKEKTLTLSSSTGFSFGIGKWAIGGKELSTLKSVERSTISGQKKISYIGARGFEDYLGKKEVNFNVDFNADMPTYSKTKIPMTSEFDYSLSLSWLWKKPSIKDLGAIVDHAALWEIIKLDEEASLLTSLQEELKKKKLTEASCSVKFTPAGFKELLKLFSTKNPQVFIEALGAAMPWEPKPSVRSDFRKRKQYYGSLWEYYFQHPATTPEEMAIIAGNTLKNFPSIAREERMPEYWQRYRTLYLGGLIELNDVTGDWNSFYKGMNSLYNAVFVLDKSYGEIESVWKSMRKFMSVAFYVRALGNYLTAISSSDSNIVTDMERILTIKYGSGEDSKIINMTQG